MSKKLKLDCGCGTKGGIYEIEGYTCCIYCALTKLAEKGIFVLQSDGSYTKVIL